MARMKRLEKLDGFANVQMVEVEQPEPGPDQMLIEVKRSLISRGVGVILAIRQGRGGKSLK